MKSAIFQSLSGVYVGGNGNAINISGQVVCDGHRIPEPRITVQYKNLSVVQDIKSGILITLSRDQLKEVNAALKRLNVRVKGERERSPVFQTLKNSKLHLVESHKTRNSNPWEDLNAFYILDFKIEDILPKPVSISDKKTDSPLVVSLLDAVQHYFGKRHNVLSPVAQVDFVNQKILVPYSATRLRANVLVDHLKLNEERTLIYPELGEALLVNADLNAQFDALPEEVKSKLTMLVSSGAFVQVRSLDGAMEIESFFINEFGRKSFTEISSKYIDDYLEGSL